MALFDLDSVTDDAHADNGYTVRAGPRDWTLHVGDSREMLRLLPDASVDSCVCDPPYELGFMGRKWDSTGIAYDVRLWREVLRVLKPGGHLLAFGGTRTHHRMACAIEDAGFEVRDMITWAYGSGFPKSLDVSKAIDAAAGAERVVVGKRTLTGRAAQSTAEKGGTYTAGACPSVGAVKVVDITAPATDAARQWSGWGTALKPAMEPVCVARKPLDGTVAQNVMTHGTGALNVDACRIGGRERTEYGLKNSKRTSATVYGEPSESADFDSSLGRWPANIIHDGSDAGLGDAARFFYCPKTSTWERNAGCTHLPARTGAEAVDRAEGSAGVNNPRAGAGRKASSVHNFHPTVKPVDLMRYLVTLVTPVGGLVLDPFAGSGSTGCGAMLAGCRFHGIELDTAHAVIAHARITWWERYAAAHGGNP